MNKLVRLYKERTLHSSDMISHMETLTHYATRCMSVVEFGLRGGNSTISILMGRPRTYLGVDIDEFRLKSEFEDACKENGIEATFLERTNDLSIDIPECDMLMIDTEHTNEHLRRELAKHGNKARKYIIFHDTWMQNPAADGAGLRLAIDEFMLKNPEWHTHAQYYTSCGLTVISKIDEAHWPEHLSLREALSRQ